MTLIFPLCCLHINAAFSTLQMYRSLRSDLHRGSDKLFIVLKLVLNLFCQIVYGNKVASVLSFSILAPGFVKQLSIASSLE
jgi:hypothetical protein